MSGKSFPDHKSCFRKIDTKYYEASVQFETVPLSDCVDERLSYIDKVEAVVYMISSEEELD